MRRYLLAATAAALVGASMFPAIALAKNHKVDLCHSQGDGDYHLISIPQKAAQKHIANHGDGLPGDPVPGTDAASGDLIVQTIPTGPADRVLQFDAGYVFGEDCVPELAGTVHWEAGTQTFDAAVTALTVDGNQATIGGTVTSSGGGSGAFTGDTFTFEVTDADPDLVYWTWLTGPAFQGPFTVVSGDLTVHDAG